MFDELFSDSPVVYQKTKDGKMIAVQVGRYVDVTPVFEMHYGLRRLSWGYLDIRGLASLRDALSDLHREHTIGKTMIVAPVPRGYKLYKQSSIKPLDKVRLVSYNLNFATKYGKNNVLDNLRFLSLPQYIRQWYDE